MYCSKGSEFGFHNGRKQCIPCARAIIETVSAPVVLNVQIRPRRLLLDPNINDCVCEENYYEGDTQGDLLCYPCPIGAICSGGASSPIAKEGIYKQ